MRSATYVLAQVEPAHPYGYNPGVDNQDLTVRRVVDHGWLSSTLCPV